jgi:hypothetical protein
MADAAERRRRDALSFQFATEHIDARNASGESPDAWATDMVERLSNVRYKRAA